MPCIYIFFVLLFIGSSEHVEGVMDEVEKYMMTRLYKEVFCPETTDDEKKDLATQKRIRLVHKHCCGNATQTVISHKFIGAPWYSFT